MAKTKYQAARAAYTSCPGINPVKMYPMVVVRARAKTIMLARSLFLANKMVAMIATKVRKERIRSTTDMLFLLF